MFTFRSGGGFDPYSGYESYGYGAEEPYYGYEDYSGYDYYGGDGGYGGYGGGYMAPAVQPVGFGRGRGGMVRKIFVLCLFCYFLEDNERISAFNIFSKVTFSIEID